jgi:HAD superfamily hydrolase (TIGR01509 family)
MKSNVTAILGERHQRTVRRWPAVVKAVIFDCDGLLLDTQAAWNRAFEEVAADHGAVFDPRAHPEIIGASVKTSARILARSFGKPSQVAEIATALSHALAAALDGRAQLKPGAREIVRSLAGRFKLAVASNAPPEILRAGLRSTGLLAYLHTVVAGAEVDASKPAAGVYVEACRRLGIPARAAIAIEDSRVGIVAARAAGLYVVGVTEDPRGLPADLVVDHLDRLHANGALLGSDI